MVHETTRLSLSAKLKAVYFQAFTAASSTFPCIKARSGFCRLSKQSLSRRLESKPKFQSPLYMQLNLSWTSDAPTSASGRQIFNNMMAQKLKWSRYHNFEVSSNVKPLFLLFIVSKSQSQQQLYYYRFLVRYLASAEGEYCGERNLDSKSKVLSNACCAQSPSGAKKRNSIFNTPREFI